MSANRFSVRPLYLQVRDALLEQITSGVWHPGFVMPNEGDLAREFGVSAGTIRKALDILEGERVLTRKAGRGTTVNDQGAGKLANRFCNIVGTHSSPITARVTVGSITEEVPNEIDRARLRLQPCHKVYRVRRLHLHDDRPFMVEDVSLPSDLFPGLIERPEAAERVTVLAQRYGILLRRAEERLSMAVAEPTFAEALQISVGSPVTVLDRVVFALDERAVERRVAYCNFGKEWASLPQ